jgi:hypothetical protein
MNIFGRRKKGPDKATVTAARSWPPIPPSRCSGRRSRLDIGGRSASSGPRTSTRGPTCRVRLDPYDPSTFRHAGHCEHRYTSEPALLRAILRVRDGAGGGYWWVECGACECGWQVQHYAVASMGV